MRKRADKAGRFLSIFDEETGFYYRSGIMEHGRDTGKDPFMAEFPELLDVGIMGHCAHGLSGKCALSYVQCYQNGLHVSQPNMALEDFAAIAEQSRGRVYQFALGGRGDPDQHEHFEEILQICVQNGIVPNFTTSGYGFTEAIAALCRRYCGAVAVSWYRSPCTLGAIRMLLEAGVRTNIHYVLSNRTLQEAIDRLEGKDFPKGVNAVIFLLHKPVGQGEKGELLTVGEDRLKKFFSLIDGRKYPFKIGFDSCTVPGLLHFTERIDFNSIDTCEGARWSAYITPDLKMLPCSFDCEGMRWGVDLKTHSIQEAWESRAFEAFRDLLRSACPECAVRAHCMGGCPVRREVVLCGSADRIPGL